MSKYCGLLLIFMVISCGCNQQTDYSEATILELAGESDTWELNGYEIKLTAYYFEAGNGILTMKNTTDYLSNSFSYEVYARIDDEDLLIHQHHSSGAPVNIALKEIGSIKGDELFIKEGTLNDVSDIYMKIEWEDFKGHSRVEQIDLH